MMGTMQRQLRLRAGGDGEWNADAQQRLANLLANPKRNGAKTTPLALEDKKPSSSSSTSDSSSSDSDDSSADGSQQQPPASPDVAAELTLTKAKVEETGKEATKQEFEEIFSALRHTSSELEKANTEIAQQKEIIANLSEETPLYHNHHGPIVGLSSGMRFFNSQVPSLFNIKPHAVIRWIKIKINLSVLLHMKVRQSAWLHDARFLNHHLKCEPVCFCLTSADLFQEPKNVAPDYDDYPKMPGVLQISSADPTLSHSYAKCVPTSPCTAMLKAFSRWRSWYGYLFDKDTSKRLVNSNKLINNDNDQPTINSW